MHIAKDYQHASKHINDCASLVANTPAMRYNTARHTNNGENTMRHETLKTIAILFLSLTYTLDIKTPTLTAAYNALHLLPYETAMQCADVLNWLAVNI
jgi:hypothetical protein